MSRINTVTTEVRYFHNLVKNEVSLPELTAINEHNLEKMLNRIYRYETRCIVKKQSYSEKHCIELRSRIADLLLLIDNFDLQAAIANRNTQAEDIEFVA
jgi:hypothetical protein